MIRLNCVASVLSSFSWFVWHCHFCLLCVVFFSLFLLVYAHSRCGARWFCCILFVYLHSFSSICSVCHPWWLIICFICSMSMTRTRTTHVSRLFSACATIVGQSTNVRVHAHLAWLTVCYRKLFLKEANVYYNSAVRVCYSRFSCVWCTVSASTPFGRFVVQCACVILLYVTLTLFGFGYLYIFRLHLCFTKLTYIYYTRGAIHSSAPLYRSAHLIWEMNTRKSKWKKIVSWCYDSHMLFRQWIMTKLCEMYESEESEEWAQRKRSCGWVEIE